MKIQELNKLIKEVILKEATSNEKIPTITSIKKGRDSGFVKGAVGDYYNVVLSNGDSLEVSEDEFMDRYKAIRRNYRADKLQTLIGKPWQYQDLD